MKKEKMVYVVEIKIRNVVNTTREILIHLHRFQMTSTWTEGEFDEWGALSLSPPPFLMELMVLSTQFRSPRSEKSFPIFFSPCQYFQCFQ